jgi:hypothetical protein
MLTTYPVQYLHVVDNHYEVHPVDAAENWGQSEVSPLAHTAVDLDHEYE